MACRNTLGNEWLEHTAQREGGVTDIRRKDLLIKKNDEQYYNTLNNITTTQSATTIYRK